MKLKVTHPTGFPYILFVNDIPEKAPKFFLAVDDEAARRQCALRDTAEPVSTSLLLSQFGHEQTTSFLKTFGSEWICREGMIFFKKVTNGTIHLSHAL